MNRGAKSQRTAKRSVLMRMDDLVSVDGCAAQKGQRETPTLGSVPLFNSCYVPYLTEEVNCSLTGSPSTSVRVVIKSTPVVLKQTEPVLKLSLLFHDLLDFLSYSGKVRVKQSTAGGPKER